jgi:hypothetical protein
VPAKPFGDLYDPSGFVCRRYAALIVTTTRRTVVVNMGFSSIARK